MKEGFNLHELVCITKDYIITNIKNLFNKDKVLNDLVQFAENVYSYQISDLAELIQHMFNMDKHLFMEIVKLYEYALFRSEVRRFYNLKKLAQQDGILVKFDAHKILSVIGNMTIKINQEIISNEKSSFIKIFLLIQEVFGIKGRIEHETIELDIIKNYYEENAAEFDYNNIPIGIYYDIYVSFIETLEFFKFKHEEVKCKEILDQLLKDLSYINYVAFIKENLNIPVNEDLLEQKISVFKRNLAFL